MSDDLFSDVGASLKVDFARLERPVPEFLFHYTSGPGFHWILKSDSFWGGNYKFMNDRSEFRYGYSLLRSSLLRAADAASSPDLRTSLLLMAKEIWLDEFDLYLTCFCEAEDLLSQWRGYGGQVSRYCLKLDTSNLKRPPAISSAIAVVYDEEIQREIVDKLVAAHDNT